MLKSTSSPFPPLYVFYTSDIPRMILVSDHRYRMSHPPQPSLRPWRPLVMPNHRLSSRCPKEGLPTSLERVFPTLTNLRQFPVPSPPLITSVVLPQHTGSPSFSIQIIAQRNCYHGWTVCLTPTRSTSPSMVSLCSVPI